MCYLHFCTYDLLKKGSCLITFNCSHIFTFSARGLDSDRKLRVDWDFMDLALAWCIAFFMCLSTSCLPWWSQAIYLWHMVHINLHGSFFTSTINGQILVQSWLNLVLYTAAPAFPSPFFRLDGPGVPTSSWPLSEESTIVILQAAIISYTVGMHNSYTAVCPTPFITSH